MVGDTPMFDRSYLLNPFMLQTVSMDELGRQINILANQYIHDDHTPNDVVFNINLESDILILYGEVIARFQKDAELSKLEANILEAKTTYQLRKDWASTSSEKSPAIRYFEAQAEEISKPMRDKQIEAESMLIRFKRAYDSVETKQNALKKKLEAMRYEEV